MILQLNPTIPVWVEGKGAGHALALIDHSQEHHLIWVVGFDESSQIWEIPNPQVRLQKNYTMGRMIK